MCDHGLLDLRVNVRTTSTITITGTAAAVLLVQYRDYNFEVAWPFGSFAVSARCYECLVSEFI